MEVLKCLAVDDEPHALEVLQVYTEKIPFLEMYKTTTSPWEAIKIIQEEDIHLLFLDIHMNELTGLQLLETYNVNCPVIITSAYQQYAIDGYNFDVVDYLLKPFSFERFLKAVNKVKVRTPQPSQVEIKASKETATHLYIKGDSKNKFHRVKLNDILYIEGLKNYVQFVCQDERIITLQNMKDLEQQLSRQNFTRVHRSYIVNTDKIEKVDGNTVYINNKSIPLGESYRKAFYTLLDMNRLG